MTYIPKVPLNVRIKLWFIRRKLTKEYPAMHKLIQILLGSGHLTSIFGYIYAIYEMVQNGASWKVAIIAVIGRIVNGGNIKEMWEEIFGPSKKD